jgi:putative oxidoreductase
MDQLTKFFLADRVGRPSRATLAMRVVVGAVFVVSGAIKFIYENAGPGRFAKIGFAAPAQVSAFVGTVEILAGSLLLLGLFVRLAAIPLIADMIVAIVTTKIPLLWGGGPEIPAAAPKSGLWAFAYQSRLDVSMLVSCVYLVVVGAGLLSLDAYLRSRAGARKGKHASASDLGSDRAQPVAAGR